MCAFINDSNNNSVRQKVVSFSDWYKKTHPNTTSICNKLYLNNSEASFNRRHEQSINTSLGNKVEFIFFHHFHKVPVKPGNVRNDTGRIQIEMLTKCLEKSYDLMTITRISIRKRHLSFYTISSETSIVHCGVFDPGASTCLLTNSLMWIIVH